MSSDDNVVFDRRELQDIRERAFLQCKVVSNTCWKRALVGLGDAADTLDAMIARIEVTEVRETVEIMKEIMKEPE